MATDLLAFDEVAELGVGLDEVLVQVGLERCSTPDLLQRAAAENLMRIILALSVGGIRARGWV